MPEDAPDAERIRAALDELLGWPGISRSPQLADLLRYVVEKTLAGEEGAIKAYSIAVDVFGRAQSFDAQSDPIVRVQARRLRALLEQFYESGESRADVQIHLPLGRYVPEFRAVGTSLPPAAPIGEVGAAGDLPGVVTAVSPRRRLPRLVTNGLVALGFTVIGVALAVAIVRWTTPDPVPLPIAAIPEMPRIVVGAFDNLTGQPVLDDDIALFGDKLADLLGRFDDVSVAPDGSGPTIMGTVQEADGRFVVRAILRPRDGGGNSWSGTLTAPAGLTDTAALEAAAELLAGQLGNPTGPLHAPGREWLKLQAGAPVEATPYVCDLQFMAWRDRRNLRDAESGTACLSALLVQNPDNAVALASIAALGAWRSQFLATTQSDLVTEMTEVTTAASRAVALAPQSSFAHEQQAAVLARQASLDAALGAAARARTLNPANMDALAVHGLLLWLAGSRSEGATASEAALAAIPSPPPWYFLTRALNALQEQRFFDAIDAAQALAGGDDELGSAIVLAAAPRAARADLIDRYRSVVMGSPRFQASGIIPRLQMLIRPNPILARIREGMLLAGIPVHALDGPFNPDGSPNAPAPAP